MIKKSNPNKRHTVSGLIGGARLLLGGRRVRFAQGPRPDRHRPGPEAGELAIIAAQGGVGKSPFAPTWRCTSPKPINGRGDRPV